MSPSLVSVLVKNGRSILGVACLAALLSAATVVLEDDRYTSSTQLLITTSETIPRLPGNIQSLLDLAGINPADFLNADTNKLKDPAFAYVFMSHAMKEQIAKDISRALSDSSLPVHRSDLSVEDGCVRRGRPHGSGQPSTDDRSRGASGSPTETLLQTEKDWEAFCFVDRNLMAYTSPKDRTVTVTMSAASPDVAQWVLDRGLTHFRNRLRHLLTSDAQKRLTYYKSQIDIVEDSLRAVEERWIDFRSSNQGLASARMQVEEDRIERRLEATTDLLQFLTTRLEVTEQAAHREDLPYSVLDPPNRPFKQDYMPIPLRALIGFILFGAFWTTVTLFRTV